MAWKVTAMDVRMAAALARGIDDVAAFCRAQNISRETYYKWKRRFEREGLDGLRDRSRRPNSVPNATPAGIEDAIVRARKELADAGQFNGPFSIADRLAAQGVSPVPSRATIARILARRGLVRPQPRKRPRSSYRRFQAGRPNEMWQSDWTEWRLVNQDGSLRPAAIAGTLDDHSRLLVGLRAEAGDGTGELVWAVMAAAIGTYGVPMSSLTDNGLCYSTKHRTDHRPAHFEANLAALGCQSIASTPYHPQTCGKVERFHQTLKNWLAHQPAALTTADLQAQLDSFAAYYNHRRPHRAVGRATPAQAWAARPRAIPNRRGIRIDEQFRVRNDRVDTDGKLTLRHASRLHHIGVGRAWAGTKVLMLVHELNIRIITEDGELVRELVLDPTRDYQPQAQGCEL